MDIQLNWFNSIVLFGAIQGLIFSVIVVLKKKHPGAKFLGGFFLILAYNGFETFSSNAGLALHIRLFDLLTFVPVFALGPFFYLYMETLLTPEVSFSSRNTAAHFVLPCFQLFMQLGIFLFHILSINGIINVELTAGQLYRGYMAYSEPLSCMVFLAYLISAFKVFRRFKEKERTENVKIRWAFFLLLLVSILSVLWMITVLSGYWFGQSDAQYYILEVALVFFIYWIALIGYQKISAIYKNRNVPARSEEILQGSLRKILEVMETEHLYLDPELSLNKLAMRIGVHAKTISVALNQLHKSSFNDFVNSYRVKEVKNRLGRPEYQHLTISALALECGFNSHATFQRAFKLEAGLTPTEYLKSSKENVQHIS